MAQAVVQVEKPVQKSKKVRVTGFPHYAQRHEIEGVFTNYGKFTLDKVNAKFAQLTFSNEKDADAAIKDSKKLVLYGEVLTVRLYTVEEANRENHPKPSKPRQPNNSRQQNTNRPNRRPGQPTNNEAISETPPDIISPYKLDLSGTFEQQMNNILAAIRLTQEEVNFRSQLYGDLEQALQPPWPGCRAIPFGSIPTGLGIKSSDADCYIEVPHEVCMPDPAYYVLRAKRILSMHPDLFSDLVAIPRANTPIVKFLHLPTKVNCDVTFKTPLGTQNSKLIAFLLHKDPRLLPMTVILKYWSKIHGMSGTGRLTNYALVMLVIFYLQSDALRMLPPVSILQRSNEMNIDHWNAGFTADPELLPLVHTEKSIFDLIGGFFQFYAAFNFDYYVVCPYVGYAIEKESFRNPQLLPPEFDRYRTNLAHNHGPPMRFSTAICVQDPIEQCHNVASSISARLGGDIREFMRFAAAAYADGKADGGEKFFNAVLLTRPRIVRPKSATNFKICLSTKELDAINKPDWKALICDVMRVIFIEMLQTNLFNLEERITVGARLKIKYDGVLVRTLWKRRQFALLYNHLDLVEKQKKISEEILKVFKEEIRLTFQLVMTFLDEPKGATIMLKMNNGDSNHFREFGKFYTGVVLTWLKALLSPHLKPVPKKPVIMAETFKNLDSQESSSSDSEDCFPWRPPPPVNNQIFVNSAEKEAQ